MLHRLATEKDFGTVYELYMDETANPYLTYDPMDQKDFAGIYAAVLQTGSLYVVEQDGEVIGTYRIISKENRQVHTIYLGGFNVKKTFQGKGLGAQIIEHIKKAAMENGKTRIELTVDINNSAAIALYKKTGFAIEGQIKKSYRRNTTNEYYDEFLMGIILD
jgi:RimJ/RimL family protein N-acetyltransferase